MTLKIADFNTTQKPTWCPGCGNFGIYIALKNALIELNIAPPELLNVYDIGCSGNGSNWFRSYGFHSLHGRVLPVAIGAKLANKNLNVMAFSGDGGALGEGGNHFMHCCRTNIDITYVIHNNLIYSLTTGQMSPASEQGLKTKSSPEGNPFLQLKHLQIAISAGATFVARGFADDIPGLTKIFVASIKHKGFAIVDVLQPCVTLNLANTREWYQKHTKKIDSSWDTHNKEKALLLGGNWDGGIPLGIIYEEERPTLEEILPALAGAPLIDQVRKYDVSELIKDFS